jgi:phytoene dehydrogenase-like protein
MLWKSLEDTADQFGRDARRYRSIMRLFLSDPHALLHDVLSSPRFPERPLTMAAFGALAGWPATWFAKGAFRETETRALFAGCAAHSILPLDRFATSALGLLFSLTAHVEAWPMARGGSVAITNALASYLEELGGTIHTGVKVTSLGDLPDARVALFDTDPHQLARIAGPVLPDRYLERLLRYRFGPGVFKMDWALDGPIPWKDPRCLEASTVHLGGTLEELAAGEAAMWRGEHPDRPFVLVVQQSMFDSSRAPEGKHTGYAYCHVPHGSTVDLTDVVESQMERFAPGFRDVVLARRTLNTEDFERDNPNCVGGAITGGAADLRQLFARPVARLDPYSTPNERIFICSASTPPGGGVHGMCGFNAARSALRRLERRPLAPFV